MSVRIVGKTCPVRHRHIRSCLQCSAWSILNRPKFGGNESSMNIDTQLNIKIAIRRDVSISEKQRVGFAVKKVF